MFRAKVYGVAGFERQFAVKRFHAEFVRDPATAETVASAARVYGSLEHPRIARLHEYGVTGGHTFTATELVEGMDLSRLLGLLKAQGKPLPEGAAAALISQIARTVGYAHGRGICHLGLCPTNIIITATGEARITDFGFLPPRLPAEPVADPSLRARIPYLAPEQLASESTSAATDVFQLGAIAFELFMLQPAFSGPSSVEIGKRIANGQHAPLSLPKPLAKVISRCLARSPFERFADARALADALDAATRDLTLPGALSNVAQAVRVAYERQQTMTDEEMSGALSFPLPAPPRGESAIHAAVSEPVPSELVTDSSASGSLRVSSHGGAEVLSSAAREPSSSGSSGSLRPPSSRRPVSKPSPGRRIGAPGKPGAPLSSRMPLAKAALEGAVAELDEEMPTTIRERHKGFIQPTPLGIATVDAPASLRPVVASGPGDDSAEGDPVQTLDDHSAADQPGAVGLGVGGARMPRRASREADSHPDELSEDTVAALQEVDPTDQVGDFQVRLSTPPPVPIPSVPSEAIELSAAELEVVSTEADDPGPPLPPVPPTADIEGDDRDQARAKPRAPLVGRNRPGGLPKTISDVAPGGSGDLSLSASNTWDALEPIRHGDGLPRGESEIQAPVIPSPERSPAPVPRVQQPAGDSKGSGGLMRVGIAVAAVLVLLGGGYLAYDRFLRDDSAGGTPGETGKPVVASSRDAGPTASGDPDTGAKVPTRVDAGSKSARDAGSRQDARTAVVEAPIDAAPALPVSSDNFTQTPSDDGRLTVRSKPRRAKVYIDGSPIGKTTARMDATKDRHRLVVIRPGYKLFTAEVQGSGEVKVILEEAPALDGPAGIKVRCSRKNRYYVFVDGVPTGQLCPTERLGVALGAHTVEIYDPVTETRRQFPVTVEDTRRSVRVRVD